MIKIYFGEKIASLRQNLDMTQEEVAEAAGITARYLQKIEAGEQTPHYSNLFKLAEVLQTTPDKIVRYVFEQWKRDGRPD